MSKRYRPKIDSVPTISTRYFIKRLKKATEDQILQQEILLTYGENHKKGKAAIEQLNYLNTTIKCYKDTIALRAKQKYKS